MTNSSNEGSEQHKTVVLRFRLDVAQKWKEKFEQEKHKCPAIAHLEAGKEHLTCTNL